MSGNTVYLRDCESPLQIQAEGYFQRLQEGGKLVSCFVSSVADVVTMAELVESCGIRYNSVVGKRVRIVVEEV